MTLFAAKVYKTVLSIPLGQVRSYKWVAQRIGSAQAARAVGQVLKRNPYPLIIPCHRVIKADGKMGGYSRGVRKKERFLAIEREIVKNLRDSK